MCTGTLGPRPWAQYLRGLLAFAQVLAWAQALGPEAQHCGLDPKNRGPGNNTWLAMIGGALGGENAPELNPHWRFGADTKYLCPGGRQPGASTWGPSA
jgi:hypothetical protein